MFRKQFEISKTDVKALREICVFLILFYIERWFTAPDVTQAPYGDFRLFQNLLAYKKIHLRIASAALEKLCLHFWYLHEHLAVLALFDPSVSREQKLKMVDSLKTKDSSNFSGKRITIKNKKDYVSFSKKEISNFVSKESLFIFKQFELSWDFIDIDPESWDSNENYKKCFETFKQLQVVNDTAERGVALIEKYNNSLTHDEEQRQYILQIVQEHRKKYPTCNKQNFVSPDASS